MLELYDCTLREGEQAGGVSFSVKDRVDIIKALDELGMPFVEVGWPIHEEVVEAFEALEKENLKTKLVAFGSTSLVKDAEQDTNLNSIIQSKAEYACIFGKTWLEHVEKQLKISSQENLEKISKSIEYLRKNNIDVFYDAEHYFDGFKANSDYALAAIEAAVKAGASRIILCDTNGGSLPEEVVEIIKKTKKYLGENKLNIKLGIHIHNDSGLALANSLEALPFVEHVQGTINGLGERVGNLDLCEFIPLLMLKKKMKLNFNLEKLKPLSELVYKAANLPSQIRQAFVSKRAFSHKGGIHIDATSKGASYSHVMPEELGLEHSLILTSLGGSACVVSTAGKFGITLDKKSEEMKKKIENVLAYLREQEKQGYDLGNIEAEQFRIINKFFGDYREFFKIEKWEVFTGKGSRAFVKVRINGDEIEEREEVSGGPVEALYNALKKAVAKKYPEINKLELTDYKVRIAKAEGSESSVRTSIEFSDEESFSTIGVSENIIESSLEAIEKAFNYYLNIS